MRYNILYKTTNLVNGKIYIGVHSTDNLDDGYLGSGVALLSAIKEYGRKSFTRDILKFFYTQQASYAEEFRIVDASFIDDRSNYNIKIGGEGTVRGELNINYGRKHSKEFCRNSSERQRKKNPLLDQDLIDLIQTLLNKNLSIKQITTYLNEKGVRNCSGNEWASDGIALAWNIRKMESEGRITLNNREHWNKGTTWNEERIQKRSISRRNKYPLLSEDTLEFLQDCLNKDLYKRDISEMLTEKGVLNSWNKPYTANTIRTEIKRLIREGILDDSIKPKKLCPNCNNYFYRNKQKRSLFERKKYCSLSCANDHKKAA